MKTCLFLLLSLFCGVARAQTYTYTVGQNLRWDEGRVLRAGESVHIPAGTLPYCTFQIVGPGVTIVNDGNWSPGQLALEHGALLTNNGNLNAFFLDVADGTFANNGTATFLNLPIRAAGTVRNKGSIWLGWQLSNAGRLQNCGTIRFSNYQSPVGGLLPGGQELPCGPLPVTLLTFTAHYAGGAVALAWAVAQEVNVARYEVERSGDGQRFSRVSDVLASGAPAYAARDGRSPETVYYRLKVVDRDATYAYSPVVAVAPEAPGQVVSVHYCDILGRAIAKPSAGFYIEISRWDDGHRTSRKFYQP
ncbi:hypothetical protein [Hymenobacter sp. PAMC 26628]|uniref:hypothetical protein n=1 Tax=Hymenobacter sp. PAMC 26628 TaxID=1484118 RepID=UPI0007701928|nr:hypothetical protein [Hymenobacter sp. PAMC 26628]AMJ65050.1 hypothetical protein AXW84_06115 [Hymenobacter sp. PAMC 26628]